MDKEKPGPADIVWSSSTWYQLLSNFQSQEPFIFFPSKMFGSSLYYLQLKVLIET